MRCSRPAGRTFRYPQGAAPGRDGFKPFLASFRAVFPDLTVTPEDVIVSGDRVAVRMVIRGTHRGEILGIPATGRQVAFRAHDFHRLEDGMITQTWHLEDFLALLDQLGATITTQA